MRILHVADLHQHRGWFAWVKQQAPQYDAVVIAGDLLNIFDRFQLKLPEQIKWTMEWLREFPVPLFVCSGNHDFFARSMGNERFSEAVWLRRCARPNLWVDGQTAELGGLRWAVLSWGWREWPEGADVVVVHAPPTNTAIAVEGRRDVGDPEVYAGIVEHGPRLVLSGHVHEAPHCHARIGSTDCFNPGCDFTSEVPAHVVIDTISGTAICQAATEDAPRTILLAQGLSRM